MNFVSRVCILNISRTDSMIRGGEYHNEANPTIHSTSTLSQQPARPRAGVKLGTKFSKTLAKKILWHKKRVWDNTFYMTYSYQCIKSMKLYFERGCLPNVF